MRVSLNGYVVSDNDQWLYDWFEIGAFSPGTVRQALADNPEGEDLELEINSPGGSVFAGFEMYSLLREAKCNTVAIVQSLAGSAASTVMAGCREVRMSPVAQVMIHLPSSTARGNQNDMRHEAKVLEQVTQSILNGYEEKCAGKTTRDRLDRLIRSDSWLTAQEAVELGLADSILGQEVGTPLYPESLLNAAVSAVRAMNNATGPCFDIVELKALYKQLVREGAAPAEGHPVESASSVTADAVPSSPKGEGFGPGCLVVDTAKLEPGTYQVTVGTGADWRVQARLELERNRFLNIGGYKNG